MGPSIRSVFVLSFNFYFTIGDCIGGYTSTVLLLGDTAAVCHSLFLTYLNHLSVSLQVCLWLNVLGTLMDISDVAPSSNDN